MKGKYHRPLAPDRLYGIKTGPVRGMVYALPVKKMPEVWGKPENHQLIRVNTVPMEKLHLLYRVVKLCMHRWYFPFTI